MNERKKINKCKRLRKTYQQLLLLKTDAKTLNRQKGIYNRKQSRQVYIKKKYKKKSKQD